MKKLLLLRLYVLLLVLLFCWVLLGAPLFSAEWQDVPHRLHLMFLQLPLRMGGIFANWH